MNNLNIGIIGCGNMAKDLARRCVNMGRARIVAVSDPNPGALHDAAVEFNAEEEKSFEKLCARSDVDAVLIGSPGSAHRENVLAAVASRKPIFCEKPLGITVRQCDEMIAACKKSDVPLFVGQVLQLFPLFTHSKYLIDEGKIGTPRAVSISRTGYSDGFMNGWREKREFSGGLLLEVNVHEFDYMRFLLGEPHEVYARMDNLLGRMDYEDQAFVLVSFESGATACLHTSLSSPIGEYRVSIQGTGGSMTHSGFGGTLKYKTITGETEEFHPADIEVPNPYDKELTSWLDSLTVKTEPLFTGKDGRAAVAVAEAAYRSAEENRPVRIAELG